MSQVDLYCNIGRMAQIKAKELMGWSAHEKQAIDGFVDAMKWGDIKAAAGHYFSLSRGSGGRNLLDNTLDEFVPKDETAPYTSFVDVKAQLMEFAPDLPEKPPLGAIPVFTEAADMQGSPGLLSTKIYHSDVTYISLWVACFHDSFSRLAKPCMEMNEFHKQWPCYYDADFAADCLAMFGQTTQLMVEAKARMMWKKWFEGRLP